MTIPFFLVAALAIATATTAFTADHPRTPPSYVERAGVKGCVWTSVPGQLGTVSSDVGRAGFHRSACGIAASTHTEDLEQLRTIVQSSGFNPHRNPADLDRRVKMVSMVCISSIIAVFIVVARRPLIEPLIFTPFGLVIGTHGGRDRFSSVLRRRFAAAVRRGTPDAIDLLVGVQRGGNGSGRAGWNA